MFAEQTGQNISYEAILAPLEKGGFKAKVLQLRDKGYKGCNVTVPFKFEAFQLAKPNLSDRAQGAQAVNTLKFDDNTIFGDNTDGAGLLRDIEQNIGIPLHGKRVLLMGAGGAASGVVVPMLIANATITIVNRDESKAQRLAEGVDLASMPLQMSVKDGRVMARSYMMLGKESYMSPEQQFDVVVNATSTGLSDEMPPLPDGIFAPGALAYDMMYGRGTPFMKFALSQGVSKDRVVDGLGMLVEQAAESFFIWRGVRPETAPVIAALRKQQ